MSRRTFSVTAERGRGPWWVTECAEVGAVSQVRRLDQAADDIREAIAYLSGLPEDSFDIEVAPVLPDAFWEAMRGRRGREPCRRRTEPAGRPGTAGRGPDAAGRRPPDGGLAPAGRPAGRLTPRRPGGRPSPCLNPRPRTPPTQRNQKRSCSMDSHRPQRSLGVLPHTIGRRRRPF